MIFKSLLFPIFMLFAGQCMAQVQVIETPGSNPITLTVTPSSRVNITGITEICKGSQTTLKVEGDYESFLWNTGGTERYLKVSEEGVYEVTVKTKGGCSYTSSVNVRIRPCT